MRTLTTDFKAQLIAGTVVPVFLFQGDLSSGSLLYTTCAWDLTWDSKTWLGDGKFKIFDAAKESNAVEANSLRVQLTGEPSALISMILTGFKQQKPGKLYLAFLDTATFAIVSDPDLRFSGRLDSCELEDDPDGATITLTYESKLVDLDRTKEFRYNNETQQIFYPGDKGFEYIPQMANWSGYWGKPAIVKKPKKKKRK